MTRNKNAEWQTSYRARRKHGGLFKKLEIYVHDDDKIRFKQLESECRKKRLAEFNEKSSV